MLRLSLGIPRARAVRTLRCSSNLGPAFYFAGAPCEASLRVRFPILLLHLHFCTSACVAFVCHCMDRCMDIKWKLSRIRRLQSDTACPEALLRHAHRPPSLVTTPLCCVFSNNTTTFLALSVSCVVAPSQQLTERQATDNIFPLAFLSQLPRQPVQPLIQALS